VRLDLAGSEIAEEAARELLLGASPPTALFAGQNLITVGALRALRDAGLQHRVALVAHDEVVLGDIVEPGVTVIAQDPVGLGQRAAELVFSRLEGYDGPSREVILPTRYIPRGSGELAPPEEPV
jgi:LacI family transcriptional regulator